MLISRGASLLKIINRTNGFQNIRNMSGGQWYYRAGVHHHSKATIIGSYAAGSLMWWWILWHLFTEYEHITGEFHYPDPRKWTDAELGIE